MNTEIIFFWLLAGIYSLIILLELRANYIQDNQNRDILERPNFFLWFLSRQYYMSGLQAMDRKKYKKALLQFKRALQFDPHYGPAYLEMGKSLFFIGKLQSSQGMIEKAVKLEEENAKNHLNLGIVLSAQGNYQEAIIHLDRACSIDKYDFDIYLYRGACLFELRKINMSVESFIKSLHLVSNYQMFTTMVERFVRVFDSVLYKAIINFLEKLDVKYDDITVNDNFERSFNGVYTDDRDITFSPVEKCAILMLSFPAKDCASIMQKFPSVFIKKLAEIMAGLSDVKLNEKKLVLGEFLEIIDWREIIKTESEEAKKYYNLGKSFMERTNLDLAITQFKKALRIDPNYIEARKDLGYAFAKSGQLNDAISEWEKAIASGVKDSELHKKLGDAYAKQGNLSKASYEWKKASAVERSNGSVISDQ
ncbi:MAG: tetratricopeptide repeat protein [Candidatus Eremiobacterota bacterium]